MRKMSYICIVVVICLVVATESLPWKPIGPSPTKGEIVAQGSGTVIANDNVAGEIVAQVSSVVASPMLTIRRKPSKRTH